MDSFLAALTLVAEPNTLISLLLASLFGLTVGALPGLTATMAVALLIPITFFLSPLAAIATVVSAAAMAIFAGDIPGALLRMPGTPASAAYCDEAYAMTRRGDAGLALGINALGSAFGGIFGTIILMFGAQLLAQFALGFSSFEFFWLACLGLSSAVLVSGRDRIKGAISLLVGVLIATIGIDYTTGHPRFTFGVADLYDGISFIPALIGMFALAEILRTLLRGDSATGRFDARSGSVGRRALGEMLGNWRHALRGSALGTAIGALPGAGADIASWISFAVAKRFSRHPERWGKGNAEGIVAGSSANNAALSAAWIPALVFAIPGDTITAIAIGVLYLKGLNPGPTVFIYNADLVYAVFLCFLLANILLLPFGFLAIRAAGLLLRIPRQLLMPALLVLAIVGSYAIENSTFGIGVMLALGLLAYFMEENGFPIAPTVLGIVLGELVEQHLMQALVSTQGDVLGLFERPIAGVLGVATLAIWILPLAFGLLRRRRRAAAR